MFVNVSYHILSVLHVNEHENLIKFVYTLKKEWYNSYLTFQHLKLNGRNIIYANDKEQMWVPWLEELNLESNEKCARTPKEEIIQVFPNKNFNRQYSPHTEVNNAFLFKGSENKISQVFDWTCEFVCKFEYNWYPFDTQNCFLILNHPSNFKIRPFDIHYNGYHIMI